MLEMFDDAEAELEQMSPGLRTHYEVLVIRLCIAQGLKNWPALRSAALQLMAEQPDNAQWPISLAYATRRCESIEAAREILMVALQDHPDEAIIPYNIACYDCQTGNYDSAIRFLERAVQTSPKVKQMAMEDEDLKAAVGSP